MIEDFLVPMVAVGLAEMGDKTQLSILLLSSRTKDYFRLLVGVMLGFLLADGFAILVGSWVTTVIPMNLLKLVAGAVFVVFGILILRSRPEEAQADLSSRSTFISGFSLILLSELGDKTQIASALFATEYNPVMVFFGVMTALFILSVLAIFLGKFISDKIDRKLITRIAGVIFILIGLTFAASALPFWSSLRLPIS